MLLFFMHRRNQSGRETHIEKKHGKGGGRERMGGKEIRVERCGRVFATWVPEQYHSAGWPSYP